MVTPRIDNDLLNCFSKIVAPILDRMESNKTESRVLSALGGVLLPNLIAGEIHIPGAEGLVVPSI